MLDSQVETDRVVAARRRCRSLDALPRNGSGTLLWFADDNDHVTGLQRTSGQQQAVGGNSDGGRRLSTSDLLIAGDAQCSQHGDDYDPSWCSVNNLETDCVSPRVSSNSLFSQLEGGTAASSDEVGDHVPSSSSYRLTGADVAEVAAGGRWTPCGFGVAGDEQPMYKRQSRRTPLQATVGPQVPLPTTFLLRQLTAVAGGGAPRPPIVGYDERLSSLAAATRSASCPSLVYDHRDGSQKANPVGHIPPQTADHGVNGGEEHANRIQVHDEAADGILAPASIIAHSTGCGSRSPMVWLTAVPSRSKSPPTSSGPDTSARDYAGVQRPVDDGGRKTRQRGIVSSSAMTTGRTTRRLARTKCLQWLNSFDEDD